jgi:hypothetical protein
MVEPTTDPTLLEGAQQLLSLSASAPAAKKSAAAAAAAAPPLATTSSGRLAKKPERLTTGVQSSKPRAAPTKKKRPAQPLASDIQLNKELRAIRKQMRAAENKALEEAMRASLAEAAIQAAKDAEQAALERALKAEARVQELLQKYEPAAEAS